MPTVFRCPHALLPLALTLVIVLAVPSRALAGNQQNGPSVDQWKKGYQSSPLSPRAKFGQLFFPFGNDNEGRLPPFSDAEPGELEFFLFEYIKNTIRALEGQTDASVITDYTAHTSWAAREYIGEYLREWSNEEATRPFIKRERWITLLRNVEVTYDHYFRALDSNISAKRNAVLALLTTFKANCSMSGVREREAMRLWERFVDLYVQFDSIDQPTRQREDFKTPMRKCQGVMP